MDIEKLKQEYATQDNRGTAYPIYVQVQELICIGVMEAGYSVLCPTGDGKVKNEHNCEYELSSDYDSCAVDCGDRGENDPEPEHCENDKPCGYIWYPVEFFLTIKGAEEYIKANQHNHGELRTYVSCFHQRNYEMRDFLKELGFKNAT